ncbi:GntR family transcriptional regulator [Pelagovum pacificum]|uniref:GntR family transcriptional regulator n=1 Tax=Pelagovum pacificum TaxID=2588711 RepID=A0A5C5GCM7_9RHOB|nr:GntR family transcriptional regulator [Pelagovum pacificum]QQA41458.1 GntR family transcriptional regulator [Pelagovum pacificum]TNY31739.1 GntR family transcriptional regulator [Pelagovum pacificum]
MSESSSAKKAPARRNRAIYGAAHRLLTKGELPEGLVLTESAVARLFNVSRAPAADALQRLVDDSLVFRFEGRGYIVGGAELNPVRMPLEETALATAAREVGPLDARNWRDIHYPEVEAAVASCMSYGTFVLSSAALASHLGVSRTTSNEMISRLERVNLVEQASNGRWIVPRMGVTGVRHHYQIRKLLEPAALADVVEEGAGQKVGSALARIDALRKSRSFTIDLVNDVEADLHFRLVRSCRNPQMRETIHRSQLPLIATHMAFARYNKPEEMESVLDDHEEILAAIRDGADDRVWRELMVAHLDNGEQTTSTYIASAPEPPDGLIPPFLVQLD